jgi:r-opsin
MFVGTIFTFSYVIPMSMIIYFYSQIVSHVVNHEKALREQAKKMNVESLRSNADAQKTSVEIRIAKAAITVCFLFVASWTPYAVVALIGAFGNQSLLTPGVTMIPAVCCKAVACVDPWVRKRKSPNHKISLINLKNYTGVCHLTSKISPRIAKQIAMVGSQREASRDRLNEHNHNPND